MKIITHDNINSLGVVAAIVLGAWTPLTDWFARDQHRSVEIQEAIDGYWQSPDDTAAVSRVGRLRAEYPESAQLKALEGVIHLRTADYSKALPVFLEALEAEPGNLQALAGLGKLWVERHEPSKAIGYLEDARARFDEPKLLVPASNRETVLLLLGQAYVDADRYEDAERVVVSALALPAVGSNPVARALLGHIYRLRQNYLLASQQYRRAVELQPDNKDFRFALLKSLADAGELEEEVVRLEERIGRDSSELYNPAVGDVLLDAYQLLGRREDALDLQARKHEYFRGGLNRAL